jgi:hypothetical protein
VVTWIVVGAALLGLVVMALAVSPVLAALGRLRRAVRLLGYRQAEVEKVRVAAADLAERIAEVRSRAELTQRSAAVIRARRAED